MFSQLSKKKKKTPFGSPLLVGRPRCTGIFASAGASRVDMRRAGLQNIYMYLDNPASDWTALDNPASDWTALDNHPNPLLVRLAGPERD